MNFSSVNQLINSRRTGHIFQSHCISIRIFNGISNTTRCCVNGFFCRSIGQSSIFCRDFIIFINTYISACLIFLGRNNIIFINGDVFSGGILRIRINSRNNIVFINADIRSRSILRIRSRNRIIRRNLDVCAGLIIFTGFNRVIDTINRQPRRSISRPNGADFRACREGLRNFLSIRRVGNTNIGVITTCAATISNGQCPIDSRTARTITVTHKGNSCRRIVRAHIYGLNIVMIERKVIVPQDVEVFLVFGYPIGIHRSASVIDFSAPIAVVAAIRFLDSHQDFIIFTKDRSRIDF
ncbi:hypothetical protein [Megasphaera sp.]|uniref:hypothetical protein n=1 Tax=Megasphaera sp. TaxID=2023260 RepID=UPI000415A58A